MLKLNLGNIWQVLFPCSNFKTHINVCMTIQGYTPAWIPALSKSCLVMLADRTWSYLCCIKAISESRCLLDLVMEKVVANERITFKLSKFRWHLPLLWKILNTLCSLSRVTYNIYLFKKKQTRKKQTKKKPTETVVYANQKSEKHFIQHLISCSTSYCLHCKSDKLNISV